MFIELPTFFLLNMTDIDDSSETHQLHFQTPRASLNDLPIETDSSGHSESERRGTPIPFPISDNDDVRQTNEHTVHFGADTLHSEIFPFTTDDAIHYLEKLSYNLPEEHLDAIFSLADLLSDDAILTRVDVGKAVKFIPDASVRESIGELCFQKILKDKRRMIGNRMTYSQIILNQRGRKKIEYLLAEVSTLSMNTLNPDILLRPSWSI